MGDDLYDDSDPFGDGLAGGGAQIPAPGINPMFDGQVLQQFSGYLLKKSPNRVRLNRWQKRWFVMDGDTLSWWERAEHERTREALGSCPMAEVILSSDSSPQASAEIVLKITNRAGDGLRDLFLRADTVEEKRMWMEALTKAAGGSKVDSVERLEIMSESADTEGFESSEPGDFEIPFSAIEWGTHIGKGLCSETKEGALPDVEIPLAVKTLHNFDTSDQLFAEFSRWTAALGKMRQHENVLRFVGACTTPPDLCVVYERHVSSLVAVHDTRPDLALRARMAYDVATGLSHIHTHFGTHGNLRPLNCLVKEDGTTCVGDFGFYNIKQLTGGGARLMNTPGEFSYTAPEMLRSEPATPASDVYSFGVLLLELATLTRPLYDLDQMAIMGEIGFGARKLMDEIPEECDERFADVIRQCLCVEPSDRIEVPALVERMQGLL